MDINFIDKFADGDILDKKDGVSQMITGFLSSYKSVSQEEEKVSFDGFLSKKTLKDCFMTRDNFSLSNSFSFLENKEEDTLSQFENRFLLDDSTHNKKERKQKSVMKTLAIKAEAKKRIKLPNFDLDRGCNCKKSSCLRLHCSCFKELRQCNKNCKCENCLNVEKHQKARKFVIEKTKIITQDAFSSKTITHKGHLIIKIGCRCKKGCKTRYCDCKKYNSKCSSICRCSDCANDKIPIDREEIIKIFKYHPRKKLKITINFDSNNKKKVQLPKNIIFESYPKTPLTH